STAFWMDCPSFTGIILPLNTSLLAACVVSLDCPTFLYIMVEGIGVAVGALLEKNVLPIITPAVKSTIAPRAFNNPDFFFIVFRVWFICLLMFLGRKGLLPELWA